MVDQNFNLEELLRVHELSLVQCGLGITEATKQRPSEIILMSIILGHILQYTGACVQTVVSPVWPRHNRAL